MLVETLIFIPPLEKQNLQISTSVRVLNYGYSFGGIMHSTSTARIKTLNDHNYATWSFRMKFMFEQKRVQIIDEGMDGCLADAASGALPGA
jgi:hypothetical protein